MNEVVCLQCTYEYKDVALTLEAARSRAWLHAIRFKHNVRYGDVDARIVLEKLKK